MLLLLSSHVFTVAQNTPVRRKRLSNSHVGARMRVPQPGTLDVAAFGAKADNSTDNTGAFQAALDACSDAHGGEVFVGTGFFRFKGSISIPPGCTLSGTYVVVLSLSLHHAPANTNS